MRINDLRVGRLFPVNQLELPEVQGVVGPALALAAGCGQAEAALAPKPTLMAGDMGSARAAKLHSPSTVVIAVNEGIEGFLSKSLASSSSSRPGHVTTKRCVTSEWGCEPPPSTTRRQFKRFI